MISLLRSIRKKVLRDGSFGQYAIYALGEIALIIIGILAAFWIDSWNETRREAEFEAFYLQGLQDEFHSSLLKLDTLIAVNRRTYDTTLALLDRIPRSTSREAEAELANMLITALSYEISYNPNNSMLTELIGSGKLQNIQDAALRQHLTSWESWLESITRQEQTLRQMRERAMETILDSGGSVLAIMEDAGMASYYVNEDRPGRDHSNLPLLRSLEFENRLLLFAVTAESTEINHYLPLREKIRTIQEHIKAGLQP